ncbi:MAG: hypothetical protein AAGH89_14035 [Verrucomicrobiota bacterium]
MHSPTPLHSSGMAKTLCDLGKKNLEKYAIKLRERGGPDYICKKCARVAHNRKLLCKATKLRFKD